MAHEGYAGRAHDGQKLSLHAPCDEAVAALHETWFLETVLVAEGEHFLEGGGRSVGDAPLVRVSCSGTVSGGLIWGSRGCSDRGGFAR